MWHMSDGLLPDFDDEGSVDESSAPRLVAAGRENIGTANGFFVSARRKGGTAATSNDEARRARAGFTMSANPPKTEY